MARAFRYVRPCNAVLTSIELESKTCPSEDGVRIKEEPPDFDVPSPLLADKVTQNVSTKHVRRRSNTVSMKKNERNLIRETVASNKNNSDTSRRKRKRKRHLNDDLGLQSVEKKRRKKTSSHEIKDVPLKDSTDEVTKQELCDVCFVPFFSKKKLFCHTRRYQSLIVCEYCSTPFNLRTTLRRHRMVHFRKHSPAPRAGLECFFCDRRFDNKQRVQMHLFHCHANVMQTYMCDSNKQRLTSDVAKSIENSYVKILPAGVINTAQGDICKENTIMRVINNAEENTCKKKTKMRAIKNAGKSRYRKDTTMHLTNDVKENIHTSDTKERIIHNAEENTCKKDTTMQLTNDVKENIHRSDTKERIIHNAEENTCKKDTAMQLTNDVKENIHRSDTKERVINNAEENTYKKDTTRQLTNNVKETTRRSDTKERVINNAEENTCKKDTTMRAIRNADKSTYRKDTTMQLTSNVKENTRRSYTKERVINNAEENTRKKDTTMHVIKNADRSTYRKDTTMHLTINAEENTHGKDTSEHVINNAAENTRREDTTMRVINSVEVNIHRQNVPMCVSNHGKRTSRSTCARDTTMRTIVNDQEPVEDICMNDTTLILDHVDKMKQNIHMGGTKMPSIDNAEGDMYTDETFIVNNDNEVEKSISMDNTMILADNVKRLVSKNVEENTPTNSSRNCAPTNADKIQGNISTEDNTIRAMGDVNRMKVIDTIKPNSSIRRRERRKGSHKIKQPTSIGDSTNSVPENDGKMKENMLAEDTAVPTPNNVEKENPPIKHWRRRNSKVNKVGKNSSKQRRSKVNTEIKDVQNSSIKMDTFFLNNKIKIEPPDPEEDGADSLIVDVESINEVTSTKNNITCSTENIDKSHGNAGHIQNTVEKIQCVPLVDTEMLVSSTVPTFQFNTASPSTVPHSTMPPSTVVTSTTPKKMRQTTLMEYLSFSGKNLNQTVIKTEKVDETEPSSSVSAQNAKNWDPVYTSTPLTNSIVRDTMIQTTADMNRASTPLLRLHMDPDSMINLLTDKEIKSECLDDYDSNISQNSPYNLRKTKFDSCRSSPNLHGTDSPHVKTAKKKKQTPKPKISLEEKLKAKYKCKNCVVRLERTFRSFRSDYTSKRVVFKTDMTKSAIPLQLTIGGNAATDSFGGKQTQSNSPTIRIVKLENCIVVEVMESR